jgi:hypothetical protein
MSVSKRSAGRPPIDDALGIYLFVEANRRKLGMKLYQYTSDRKTRYEGDVFGLRATGRELKGESLRRRYNKARLEIGVVEEHYEGLIVPQPAVEYALKTTERMIRELMED